MNGNKLVPGDKVEVQQGSQVEQGEHTILVAVNTPGTIEILRLPVPKGKVPIRTLAYGSILANESDVARA